MLNLRVLILPCALCLIAECSSAQADVATTYDGQEAFFSSFSRMPGSSDAPFWTTIFHYDGSGAWAAVAHSDNSGNVTAPFLTGDGSIVGWQKGPYLYPGGCAACITSQLSGIDMQSVKINPSRLAISSNGRFLATPFPLAVQDLTTGQVWNPPGLSVPIPYSGWYTNQIANDATLIGLKADTNGFVLVQWRPGAASRDVLTVIDHLSPSVSFSLLLSADAKHAVVSIAPSTGGSRISLVDLDSGSDQIIFQHDTSLSAPLLPTASVSADGSRVVFFFQDIRAGQTPQVFFWDRGTGDSTTLSGLPEGAAGAVISGNGAFAWVATKSNRLLRFDLNHGGTEEILRAFPTMLRMDSFGVGSSVPGSAVRYVGSAALPGEHFLSNGLEFPIIATDDANTTAIQVPWELAAQLPAEGPTAIPLVLQRDGYPFELPLAFSATGKTTPLLERLPPVPGIDFTVKAASADFSHLIDYSHPAMPGETIVVWLTGLGPLDQPLATGAPGPSNPPAHPLAHLDCGLANITGGRPWQGLLLPFVGYAPGLLGFYQVNVTIPSNWPAGVSLLDCYSGTQSSTLSVPVGPQAQ